MRKLRFAFEVKGKSGGVRVCYVNFAVYESIYLITVYPKSEKDNLCKSERDSITKLIKVLKSTLSKKE